VSRGVRFLSRLAEQPEQFPTPSGVDPRRFCDRCGLARDPRDLKKTTAPAGRHTLLDVVELKLCGQCRATLGGNT